MEERLDDAIHVLRTHAEGSLPPGMSPVVAGSLLSAAAAAAAAGASGGVQPVGYSSSVGSSGPSVVQPMDQMVSKVYCNIKPSQMHIAPLLCCTTEEMPSIIDSICFVY